MSKIFNKNQFLNIVTIFLLLLIVVLIVFILSNISNVSNEKVSSSQNTNTVTEFTEVTNCLSKPEAERWGCLDEFIKNYSEKYSSKDIGGILADLESARLTNGTVENQCHPIAHAIGRYAYHKYGNIGDAFEKCDYTCHSGCYHGVMERMFFDDSEIASGQNHLTFDDLKGKVPGICDNDKFDNPSNAVIFQCLHGVGHAILYSLNYDLDLALKSCDLLETDYQKLSCYGGVFMENVTAFDKGKRDLELTDPHYPCNKVDDRYDGQCYLMQTSVMTEMGLSSNEIVEECFKAGFSQNECFISIGRDASNFARTGDISYVTDLCESINSYDQAMNCIKGSSYALIDNSWDASFAFPFCSNLKNTSYKEDCYRYSIDYIRMAYSFDDNTLSANCDKFAKDDSDLCKNSM